jgi:FkbM family methyltransferase
VNAADRLQTLLDLYGEAYHDALVGRVQARIAGCGHLLIFGAGQNGRRLAQLLSTAGLTPHAFVDETPGKAGGELDGLPILDVAAAQALPRPLALVAIFSPRASYLEIAARLHAAQIETLGLFEALWSLGGDLLPFYFLDHPRTLLHERSRLSGLLGRLEDAASVETLLAAVEFRLALRYDVLGSFSIERLPAPAEWETVAMIDAGAFDGDTLVPFARKTGERLRAAIGVEPDPVNHALLVESLGAAGLGAQVRALCAAVAARSGTRSFAYLGHQGSRFDAGGMPTRTVAIDDLVESDLPHAARLYLKLDVEGAEAEALAGAARTIATRAPILSIAAYHHPTDLWRLAEIVSEIDQDYRFRLLSHGADGADLTLYAIPPK